MPRLGRVVLPHFPHHVVQRGHNRQVVFAREQDYQRYLTDLQELAVTFEVKVYAYCLMTNHVHLLLAPGKSASGLGQLMKALAARTTRYRNKLERRSGTLWESRYKSSLVQTDAYLLACSRYIELNPVRARMVADPAHYLWSSFNMRQTLPESESWLASDPCYLGLGRSESERRERYARFVRSAIPDDELALIRSALQRGQLTGSPRFTEEISQIIGRRIEFRGQGRPRKSAAGEAW